MAKLNWTEESVNWLRDIFEFLESDNPVAARKVVDGIYDRTQILLDHPEIGYRYENSKRNVRILLYGHYRIAYLIKLNGNIDILGVFHGSLDIGKYLL